MSRPTKERVQQLREATQRAFPIDWPPMPSQMTADVCDDCNIVAETLRGRTWPSLSPHEVDALSRGIPLLSARALRYYFPAVVMRGLNHPASPAIAALASRLASPEEPDDWRPEHRKNIARTRAELLALLRPEQLGVLRSCAEWASAYASLRAAAASILERYAAAAP